MLVFDSPAFADHEEVVFFEDRAAGLRAIVAIHDTTLGPAVGGCRLKPYGSIAEATFDVLRLAQGMSFKAALAGLPCGGGKAVVIGEPANASKGQFRAFGRAIDGLGGRYYTAEDVGTSPRQMDWIGEETPYVLGKSVHGSGDPSPVTAKGVLIGIETAVRHRLGRISLKGLRVAVQGLGHVGHPLVRLLVAEGAVVTGADADPALAEAVARELGIRLVGEDEILFEDADVLAPCALGGVLSDTTIPKLRAGIVAGAANNQLLEPRHGEALRQRGILYAPDYVINAGGLINVADELGPGGYSRPRALDKVRTIGASLEAVFTEAASTGEATSEVADRIARQRIQAARPAFAKPEAPPQKARCIALAS